MINEERKYKILSVIIDKFIEHGEPIGSKLVSEFLDLNVSSATIRNEMAELSILGYLTQPHVSAGRLPSDKGYRLYIDKLMNIEPLCFEEKNFISEILYHSAAEPEKLIEKATEILAKLASSLAIITTPPNGEAKIKNIQFLQISTRTAMMVLMTDTGMIKNLLFRCDYDLSSDILNFFRNVLMEKFCQKALSSINAEHLKIISDLNSDMSILLMPVIQALINTAKEAENIEIKINGQNNLLKFSNINADQAIKVLELLDKKENISNLLFENNKGINVFIGGEIRHKEFENLSIITAEYSTLQRSGAIGLICPIRINYSKIISLLEYVSKLLSNILSKILEN